MRILVLFFSFIFSVHCFANNIIVNGTRFIYPGNDKEITVQLNNKANRPAIAQIWLDNGDPHESPDTIKTPFQITPPIARLEANGGQAIRIKLVDKMSMVNDKETLWWLNILDIPPTLKNQNSSDDNFLQLAIRSRFKFIYRPNGLGNRDLAPQKLVLSTKGKQLIINNPTPFYITVTQISVDGKTPLNQQSIMLAPQSSETIALNQNITSGETLILHNINDYGANIAIKVAVK